MPRDLNLLYTFLQVVNSGSFTAAGKVLHTPTSTISRHITRLEAELGVRLLHRTTRSLRLTEAGQLYYESGLQIQEQLEHTENLLAAAQATPTGKIRVSAPVEYTLMLKIVTLFLRQYPSIQLELELTNRPVNLVEEGVDIAIRAGNLPDSSLVAYKLVDSPSILTASRAYLEENGTPQSVSELAEHTCILFGSSVAPTTWHLVHKDESIHVRVQGQLAINHMEAVRDAALEGLGIALLPAISCVGMIQERQLQAILPEFTSPSVPLSILYPSRRYLAPAVRTFVDFFKENFQTVMEQSIELLHAEQ